MSDVVKNKKNSRNKNKQKMSTTLQGETLFAVVICTCEDFLVLGQ